MSSSPPTNESGITTMEQDIRRRVKGGYYQAPEATNDVLWLLAALDDLKATWKEYEEEGDWRLLIDRLDDALAPQEDSGA